MVISEQNFSTTVGFCLLPSELIQKIILQLGLPEILRLKTVSKSIAAIISEQDFVREYNMGSSLSSWLFIYKRRWRHDAVLDGFNDRCSNRWFKIPVADYLFSRLDHREDLYFLAASGNIFLFVSNTRKVVISVNLVTRTVKEIPPSPLGPRGTSSWRRSGMKLVGGPTGSDEFRFMYAELHEGRPILFMYESLTEKWRSMEAQENYGKPARVGEREVHTDRLNVINGLRESLIIAAGFNKDDAPVILRPRFDGEGNEESESAVGYSWGNVTDRIHVYGDGNMMVVRSDSVDDSNKMIRVLSSIELWGLSLNGSHWELISKVPNELLDKSKKPYKVIMGCLEERNGIIRAVLMSQFEGKWDIIWLSFDVGKCNWTWVPLPDCKMEGANMAGIAFSSGLRLS